MNKYPMSFAPKHWSPNLIPWVVRCLSPLRRRRAQKSLLLNSIRTTGTHHIQRALASGQRLLIAPNHPSHADPFAIYEACEAAGTSCHILAAWHVFSKHSWIMRRCLQWHGCFSIDREANDLTAFREAVGVLTTRPEPLVIFPEGDIYHCNDRLTPLREGTCAIALAAAKRAQQGVAIIPTAIRYRCAEDPTPGILAVLDKIESRLLWRSQPHLPIVKRILNIGNAVLGLKEHEYLGHSIQGELPGRIAHLCNHILERHENKFAISPADSIPKRVKQLRHAILSRMNDQGTPIEHKKDLRHGLDDAFLALQLFSYPGDYLTGTAVSMERIAETVDKLEEDVLQVSTATIRCRRDVHVHFGEPLAVPSTKSRTATIDLTDSLATQIQQLLHPERTQSQRSAIA